MVRKELQEAKVRLYQKKDRTRLILAMGAVVFAAFMFVAVLNLINSVDFSFRPPAYQDLNGDGIYEISSGYDSDGDGVPDQGEHPLRRFLNWTVLGILALIGPYGFYLSSRHRTIKLIERRLPDFLRDVAEAGRFGMTLAEAIVVASSGRYGKLTPEIRKMAAQISWGVPASEALRLFAERVKTPMVSRVVSIIVKASDAGGDVADVLSMVSHDAKEVQLTEDERRIAMSTYIAVIYIAFLVFLVTIWILNATFLPKLKESGQALTGGATDLGGILPQNIDDIIFNIQLAFFIAAVVHAVGDGILAGVLDNGKIASGLRHSFVMLIIALLGFQLV
jgi:flagellar protein FlaJ